MPCLQVLLILFGLVGIIKGQFNITKNLRVSKSVGRILGIVLLIGGVLSLFNGILGLATLGLVIAVGVIKAEATGNGLDTKLIGNSLGQRIVVGILLGLVIAASPFILIGLLALFGPAIASALR
jgi:hypothetical protein